MNVSLNWLKDYLDIHLSPERVGELLTDIGLEVEGMEEVESIKGGLKGVVVGHVKECGKHPNADKLSVTKVDVGGEELLSIVCGAPNVAAGQKVLVATVGAELYPKGAEEGFKIKKSKIRGELSQGMICAEDELGLGDSHDGIIVLPEETPLGIPASDYYKLESDYVYEIGLTPNRSDATNHIGVAKDLIAYLKVNENYSEDIRLPSVEDFKVDTHDLPIEVVIENEEASPRYAGVTIKNLTIKDSPEWLKQRLEAIGVRPISNIVDITNFVLHEFGQPLHAFDYDKITGQKIIVKTLPSGTKFLALDETERELSDEDLMICDGESKGMCIGGVFGGLNSGVTDGTKNIFLEAAHFNPKMIRRTSMRHNLRTDAAKVFEKGSDPNITVYALKRAALLMKELAGGTIASDLIDHYPNPIERKQVEIKYAHINRLIGVEIPESEVRGIIAALEMEVIKETADGMTVSIPTNKSDVTREADVIEEILRIYGFNKVPMPSKVNSTLAIAPNPDPNEVRNRIGDQLAANGFNEMMAVSLSESRYYTEYWDAIPEDQLVYVNNTSNIHLDIMRPSMLFSGLEAIVRNQNRQQPDIKLFEFGKTYLKQNEGYKEDAHLSIFLAGQRNPEGWLNTQKETVNFYSIKTVVQQVLGKLGITDYQESAFKDNLFATGLRFHRGQQVIAEFGKVVAGPVKQMGVRGPILFADIRWDTVLKAMKKHRVYFEELSKYPTMRRDLALVIDNSVKFSDIVAIAKKSGKQLLRDINLFDVYENASQLGEGKKSYAVSFIFEDKSKTLKDKEVDKVMNTLIQRFEAQLGANIRK